MKKTKKTVISALIAAFTCVATLISIGPLPPANGYVHLGDALVLFAGFLLGPLYGGISAALGSAIADISLGYTAYAPATFVIKFMVACSAGLIYKLGDKSILKLIFASMVSELIMICGYFVYESFLLGGGIGTVAALGSVPANVFQAISAVVIGCLIANTFKNNSALKKFTE